MAVDYCIEKGILADILVKCKSEVKSMLLTEFDEKLYKRTIYKEGYDDGIKEGHKRGMSEGFERGINKGFERGISEARKQDIKNSIEMLKSMDLPDDKIASLVAKNYAVSEDDVIKEINKMQ